MEKITGIMEGSLLETLSLSDCVMGYKVTELLSEKELGQRKIEYIIQLIRYAKKNPAERKGDE